MKQVELIYDELQHCTAIRLKNQNKVAMDCPHTGKGEEFSPGEMAGTSVAGCMLLAMGAFSMRHDIDLTNTRIDIETKLLESRIDEINLTFNLPKKFSEEEMKVLKRAADNCPIKHSFIPEVKVNVTYNYPS